MKSQPVIITVSKSPSELGNTIIKTIAPLVARGVHSKKEFVIRGVPNEKGFTFTIEPNEDLTLPTEASMPKEISE